MTERRAITLGMKLESLFLRRQVLCVECGEPIEPGNCQWDHRHSLAQGGGHNAGNIGPVHYDPCHKSKSAKDERDLHHVDRLAKERAGQPKRKRVSRSIPKRAGPIQSPGFPKNMRRKMNGTTERITT